MLKVGNVSSFSGDKQFKCIKELGSGGTGDTYLFEDEITDMLFAIKKYSPKDINYLDEYYDRFIDEIKILFKISHPNIVRIYNYYLYPENKTGYLQMEYIDGISIDEFIPDECVKGWHDIFIEVITAFEYLEQNKILHRDIRPPNILIDKDENVKIIDFGFGKKLEPQEENGKSVFLNWPVSNLPEEILKDKIYNNQTEIYFIGKLFKNLLKNEFEKFRFRNIIEKMIMVNSNDRYKSFFQVSLEISNGIVDEIDFTKEQKNIYLRFADKLYNSVVVFYNEYEPINDIYITLNKLAEIIRNSSLEEYIQNVDKLIFCFISGGFKYTSKLHIEVDCVVEFYKLIKNLNTRKQKIVLDNIYTRLSKIEVEIEDDSLPF